MKKMFLLRPAGVMALVCASVLAFAACSGGGDNPVELPTTQSTINSKTLYNVSTFKSDYLNMALSNCGIFYNFNADISSTETAPDVFVVNGADIVALTPDQARLAALTCLQGKTLIFDVPMLGQILGLKAKIDAAMSQEKNAALKAECVLSANSIYNFIDAANHLKDYVETQTNSPSSESYTQKVYEAMAYRNGHVYCVHDIDEAITIKTSATGSTQEDETTLPEPTLDESAISGKDYAHLISASAKKFSNWILEKDASVSQSKLFEKNAHLLLQANSGSSSNLKDFTAAQIFTHNFTAVFKSDSSEHYNHRWDNVKKENVDMVVSVWVLCDIEKQFDWYCVHYSTTYNNDQLQVKKVWKDDDMKISPHYLGGHMSIDLVASSRELMDFSPRTTEGSTSFTNGVSTNFGITGGVNGGANSQGPMGGGSLNFNAGITYSDSTTSAVPDIAIKLTNETSTGGGIKWIFDSPEVRPTHKVVFPWPRIEESHPGAKDIQKNVARFDTCAVYRVPSNATTQDNDHIMLKTYSCLWMQMQTYWYIQAHTGCEGYTHRSYSGCIYADYVLRPCNARRDYMMEFDKAGGIDTDTKAILKGNLIKKCNVDGKAIWFDSAPYYARGEANLDNVAKAHFELVKQRIMNNKELFKSDGFKGTYTFYIKAANASEKLTSFDVDFGQ